MYKLSHNLVDINTEEHLIPNSELRTRNSHAFKYRMPKVSKDVFKFSFFLDQSCLGYLYLIETLCAAHTIFCSKDAGQGLREPFLFQLILSKHCFCIINACTIWGVKKLAIATYIKMFVIINGFYKSLVHFLNNRLQHQLLKQRLHYLMPIILNTLMLAYRLVNGL